MERCEDSDLRGGSKVVEIVRRYVKIPIPYLGGGFKHVF